GYGEDQGPPARPKRDRLAEVAAREQDAPLRQELLRELDGSAAAGSDPPQGHVQDAHDQAGGPGQPEALGADQPLERVPRPERLLEARERLDRKQAAVGQERAEDQA